MIVSGHTDGHIRTKSLIETAETIEFFEQQQYQDLLYDELHGGQDQGLVEVRVVRVSCVVSRE